MLYFLQLMTEIVFLLHGIMVVFGDEEVMDVEFQLDYQLKFKARTLCEELNNLPLKITVEDELFICKKEMIFVVNLENGNDAEFGNSYLLMKQFEMFGLSPVITIYNATFINRLQFHSKVNFTLLGWILKVDRQWITGFKFVPPISLLPYTVVIEFPNHLYRTEILLRDLLAEPFLKWTICCPISFDYIRKYIVFLQVLESPCESKRVVSLTVVHSSYPGIVVGLSNNNKTLYYNLASLNNKQICGSILTDCKNLFLLDAVLTTRHLIFLTTKGVLVSNDLMEFSSSKPEMMTFKLIFELPEIIERFSGIEGRKQVELKSNVECDYHYVNHPYIKETVFFTISNQRSIYMSNRPYAKWELISLRKRKNELLVAVTFDWQRQQFILLETTMNISQITVLQYPSLMRLYSFVFPKSFQSSNVVIHPNSRHLIALGNEIWISEDNGVYFKNIFNMSKDDMIKPSSYYTSPSGEFAFASNMGKLLYGKIGIPRMVSSEIPKSLNDSLIEYSIYRVYINVTVVAIEEFQKYTADFELKSYLIDISEILNNEEAVARNFFCLQYTSANRAVLYEYETSPNNDNVPFGKPYIGKLLKHKLGGEAIIKDILPTPGTQFKHGLILNVLKTFTPKSTRANNFEFKIEDSSDNTTLLLKVPTSSRVSGSWTKENVGQTVAIVGFPSILLTNFKSSKEMEGISAIANASAWADWKGAWDLYSFTSKNEDESLLDLVEDECQFVMDIYKNSKYVGEKTNKFIIDLKDKLQLDIDVHSLHNGKYSILKQSLSVFHEPHADSAAIRDVKIYSVLKNSKIFTIIGKQERKANNMVFSLIITAVGKSNGLSSVIVSMPDVSLKCTLSVHFVIYSFCPESKALMLNYIFVPNITTDSYEDLPINYRPPSQFGVAVPISKHIYNADPGLPRWQDKTLLSQSTGEFKQCKNKKTKDDCGCTMVMEELSLVLYSDCKRKVRQIRHLTYVLLNFTYLKQKNQLDWASFASLEELNQRKDYSVLLPNEVEVIPDFQNMTGFSNDARLFLKGSGLYHFRVTLHSDCSKCNLTDEFQVYALPVTLPYPFYYMWNCLVVIITGVVLLATYIWYTIAHQSTNRFQRQHQIKSSSGQSATIISKESS